MPIPCGKKFPTPTWQVVPARTKTYDWLHRYLGSRRRRYVTHSHAKLHNKRQKNRQNVYFSVYNDIPLSYPPFHTLFWRLENSRFLCRTFFRKSLGFQSDMGSKIVIFNAFRSEYVFLVQHLWRTRYDWVENFAKPGKIGEYFPYLNAFYL